MKIKINSKSDTNLENKMISINENYQKFAFKFLIIITLSIGVVTFNDIIAQEEIDNEENQPYSAGQIKIPVLGEHKFMPNSLVRDPFIKTYVRNAVGIGQALNLDIPIVVIRDRTVFGLRGDLVFVSLDFEYHHAVKDWLAVWGRFNILARLGNDTQALLSQGITAVTGFEFGWLFNLMKRNNTMLSLSFNVENGNATIVNLLPFIDSIIKDDSSNVPLVNTVQSLRGGIGLRFAWSISKLFGFYATGDLLYGQSAEVRGDSEFFYSIGGVLDFDLNTVLDLPFGLLIGYKRYSFPTPGKKTTGDLDIFFFRIGYNKSSDLSIAIESSINKTEFLDQSLDAGLTNIMLRYYFD